MIKIKSLTKRFGEFTAVDHLDLTIDTGEFFGLLGPNGAGKTTTMNMITGYLAANGGTVVIDGADILKDPKKAKKNIGYLPELPPVYPDMTVKEYLLFAGELKGLKKSDRVRGVNEVMEKTNITDMKDRLIKNLSKGYKQRVGLAQAILGDPDVIILDEPTVGLDPKQIIEIRELLRSLKAELTIILSSHILQEISAVCDHIMIISHGKLVASDTAENISNMSKGEISISLLVKGDTDIAKGISENIDGVSSVTADRGKEAGTVELTIKYPSDTDLREAVFLSFASNNMPILEMSSRSESLEDIYLELTADTAGRRHKGKLRRNGKYGGDCSRRKCCNGRKRGNGRDCGNRYTGGGKK